MSIFVVFIVLAAAAFAEADVRDQFEHEPMGLPKIVGGTPTTVDRFPWQLSIRIRGKHRCGASILTKNRALSAAHCYRPASDEIDDFTVLAGSTLRYGEPGCYIVGLQKYIQHQNYNNATLENDIAVLWLQRDFEFGLKISPVNLPSQGTPLVHGSSVLVSGWGYRKENDPTTVAERLHFATTTILQEVICRAAYQEWYKPSMFCAGVAKGGKDACQGDSGGPLTANGLQVGIVSWGVGCGNAKYPGVYTNVALFRKWIDEVM